MNDNNIIKITKGTQLKALTFCIAISIVYIGALIYFGFDNITFIFVGIGFSFQNIPAIFLHIEYLKQNKGEEYELCGNRIIMHKDGLETVYGSDEIKSITIYVSPNYYRGDIYFTGFENYHFARILLNSGKVLYLTSLLAPGGIDKVLSSHLKDIPYRKVKRLFATTLY